MSASFYSTYSTSLKNSLKIIRQIYLCSKANPPKLCSDIGKNLDFKTVNLPGNITLNIKRVQSKI